MDDIDRVQEVGYITIGTTDLDAALRFYTDIIRLEVTERRHDEIFLSGGREHHWVRLRAAPSNRVHQVGLRMADEDALDRARARVEAAGIATVEAGNRAADRISRYIRFTDPAGQEIDLYCDMHQRHHGPEAAGIDLVTLLHGVWTTPHFEPTWQFYDQVLGVHPSDFIEDMAVFMHAADRYHHGIALLAGPTHTFNHFCIMVDSFDDVMRARANAVRHGHRLQMDVLRHAPSTSVGVYIEDPLHGFSVEFCARHRQIPEHGHHPRRLPGALDTIDTWQTPLPDVAPPPPAKTLDELTAELATTHT